MRRAVLSAAVVAGFWALAWTVAERGSVPAATGDAGFAAKTRNEAIAWLEAGQLDNAEPLFRELARALPSDPIGPANLGVTALRRRDLPAALAAAEQAAKLGPDRSDVLALRAEVHAALGNLRAALADVRSVVRIGSDDPRVLYAAYRLLRDELVGEAAAEETAAALRELRRLRPDSLHLAIEGLVSALDAEDRALATGDALRLRELLGARADGAVRELEAALAALEAGDLAAARLATARLRNLLLPTAEHRQSLAELRGEAPGAPVERFVREPEPDRFGSPLPIVWRPGSVGTGSVADLVLADMNGDGRVEPVLIQGEPGRPRGPVATRAADLDGDGSLDLVLAGGFGLQLFAGDGRGGSTRWSKGLPAAIPPAVSVEIIDLDLEGDLDLVAFAEDGTVSFVRAAGDGRFTLEPLLLPGPPGAPGAPPMAIGDLDRDGDCDFVVGGAEPAWLENRLGGGFVRHPLPAGAGASWRAAVLADLESDGWPDLWVATGNGLERLGNEGGDLAGGTFRRVLARPDLVALASFDGDNDGRLDFAAATEEGLLWIGQSESGELVAEPIAGVGGGFRRLLAGDLDGDGDLDLVAAGPSGHLALDNDGGNGNRWLDVRLRALRSGNGKNSLHGIGARIELRAGTSSQWREVTGETTRFGLGELRRADVLRVVWPNGVVQDRIGVDSNLTVVEEQVLKGSCPFLYVWDGESVRFVTDLLWGAPLGMPVAPGLFAGSDPTEIVRADGLVERDGVYDLRITEELWEAAFFDSVRLWVVDHPEAVEVASNLRVVAGEILPELVLGSRELEPVVEARDGDGTDVTDRLRERDEVYAGSFDVTTYQGIASPWTFSFALPRTPRGTSRLHLDGWIFPSDASINIAVAQRPELAYVAPRIEVETDEGWRPLVPKMGLPPGKTKTMVIDLPPLPPAVAARPRLRIVSSLWLAWDRIAWTEAAADDAVRLVERLPPMRAELRHRGFSIPERVAPNAPHGFRYDRLLPRPPWLPFPGRYTRYGEVVELLLAIDDRFAILAAGDEMAIEFDASRLPPPPAGYRRTLFLESTGWDKDADRHTWEAARLEPLPFHGMSGYPFREGERAPDSPEHDRYREEWLTREIRAPGAN